MLYRFLHRISLGAYPKLGSSLPEGSGQVVCFYPGQLGIPRGDHHGGHADVRDIGPTVAVGQRGREYLGMLFQLFDQPYHRCHRIERRLRHLAGEQERDLGEAHLGMTSSQDVHEHLRGSHARFEGICVRGGMIGYHCVYILYHLGDDVGMHVQGDGDGYLRAELRSQVSE